MVRPGMFETWVEFGAFFVALLVAYAVVVGVFFGLVWAVMGGG